MLIKEALLLDSKPAVAGFMFFLLEQKEPKIQECRIASGRHSALRAWVDTFIMMTFLLVNILVLSDNRFVIPTIGGILLFNVDLLNLILFYLIHFYF